MVVHVLISDEGKLLGLFTSGVDAHEVHKQYPRSTVSRMRLNEHIPPCQHEYEANERFEGLQPGSASSQLVVAGLPCQSLTGEHLHSLS